jgi:hypothetical protein
MHLAGSAYAAHVLHRSFATLRMTILMTIFPDDNLSGDDEWTAVMNIAGVQNH